MGDQLILVSYHLRITADQDTANTLWIKTLTYVAF